MDDLEGILGKKRRRNEREGGYAAFDKLVVGRVMDVVDATKWALRCKACHSQASLARVLEEALSGAMTAGMNASPLPSDARLFVSRWLSEAAAAGAVGG